MFHRINDRFRQRMRLRRSAGRNLNRIFKAIPCAALKRFNPQRQQGGLLFSGEYLAEPLGMFCRLRNRFAVRYLRLADTGFHLKVLQHPGC